MDNRLADLQRFYELMAELDSYIEGKHLLRDCHGRMNWPMRGVYFFFEDGEVRGQSGNGPRVVRVGTHALKSGSRTSLWKRLSQHKGVALSGGGNHRGSIFRLIVGTALLERDGLTSESWDNRKSTAPREVRLAEQHIEQLVSGVIGAMPFLWLDVGDDPGAESERGIIERGSIALLSNWRKEPIDPPSSSWLGKYCNRERIRSSGLWNSNHVDEAYDPNFLDVLESRVEQIRRRR
ncbi:hypothetical protein [Vannielia litorea]|uniref:GIY-YIG domain-containing protein n=1 Tax=Vannielia litorea TaxID=1217970 RepID=A0A1N6E3X2_9RHOB|nr:hypothetical protein [Vannielia litorea]SIN77738.1 hypothetical protein SAMN05444002_0309 [Vannielia litorea]